MKGKKEISRQGWEEVLVYTKEGIGLGKIFFMRSGVSELKSTGDVNESSRGKEERGERGRRKNT